MSNPTPTDEGKDALIDDLLSNLPTNNSLQVNIPSENISNCIIDPGNPVTVRPMNYDDEKVLANAGKGHDQVNILLQQCVSNVRVMDLLPMDKLYLVLKLREISFGDEYPTLLICSKCRGENPATLKLSELNVNPVPDDFTEIRSVSLPMSKLDVKVRIPRVKDEQYMKDSETLVANLWRFIVSIGEHRDPSIFAKVIERLKTGALKDIRVLVNALKTNYGVDTKVKLECKHCGEVTVVDLPIDANFFNVN